MRSNLKYIGLWVYIFAYKQTVAMALLLMAKTSHWVQPGVWNANVLICLFAK